jgi:hypothetical protein
VPSDDAAPVVDAEAAAAIAWAEDPPDGNFADSASAVLASYAGALVWNIEYEGVCPYYQGPPIPPSQTELVQKLEAGCGTHRWNVVIDAMTGEFLVGFMDGYLD